MSISAGRKKAQAYIDSEKQYNKRVPSHDEVIEHVNKDLPDDKKYTESGAKNLLAWLKF